MASELHLYLKAIHICCAPFYRGFADMWLLTTWHQLVSHLGWVTITKHSENPTKHHADEMKYDNYELQTSVYNFFNAFSVSFKYYSHVGLLVFLPPFVFPFAVLTELTCVLFSLSLVCLLCLLLQSVSLSAHLLMVPLSRCSTSLDFCQFHLLYCWITWHCTRLCCVMWVWNQSSFLSFHLALMDIY